MQLDKNPSIKSKIDNIIFIPKGACHFYNTDFRLGPAKGKHIEFLFTKHFYTSQGAFKK